MKQIPFREKELQQARSLLDQKAVKSITFSEGTYQVEVSVKGESFWPFLQITETGDILDAFCSCSKEGSTPYCCHLATGYLAIVSPKNPLHVRFRTSLWNRLCWIGSRRHGYRTDCLEKKESYEARSLTGKLLFSVRSLNEEAEKRLSEILEFREVETEETSLKFSNLPPEEIALWKQGKPSEKLKYELSFWSDIAKWCLMLQEAGDPYEIQFLPQGEDLPKWIQIRFSCIEVGFYISKGNWSLVIPSLHFVKSPLKVQEVAEKEIESIEYNPEKKRFDLTFSSASQSSKDLVSEKEIELDGWRFIPHVGFFRYKTDPILEKNTVEKEKIGEFLSQYSSFLRNYLKEPIFEGEYSLQYFLKFDESEYLHIEMFLFEKGDLKKEGSAFFKNWVYLQGQGFYQVYSGTFSSVETLVHPDQVGDFVSRHKTWLNQHEGFQIHLMTVEHTFSYSVDGEGTLIFSSEMELAKEMEGSMDFGEWLFVPGKGFFPKRKERLISSLKGGKKIPCNEVPSFLRSHKDELSLLPKFFSEKNPTAQFSLEVSVTEDGSIAIKPIFALLPEYRSKRVLFFQEFAFVEGEGFSKFLLLHPFLEEYSTEKVLSAKEELLFLSRLESLNSWISKIDPRLKIPKQMTLHLEDMQNEKEGKVTHWDLTLSYQTELGSVDLYEVWKAIQTHQKFLFSAAGLIDLSLEKFHWLKGISKKRWGSKKKTLSLSAMEWIRVQMTQSLSVESKVLEVFEEFHSYQGCIPYKIDGLKSDLRPYQETGLKWLWFLYSYGLSGLLCDEMGLGKTHQAMALLAAVFNSSAEEKAFLIVCPTSVIYHWEDLLKRFLPQLRVCIFYGYGRHSEDFMKKSYDVLLTSYGVLRSEKKKLSEISFDVAVFDEVQNAKNASSQTHRALASLQAFVKIGLTGTPIENNIMELKALFDLMLPHYLPSDAQFKEQFLLPIERNEDKAAYQLLSKIVKPFILRRKKTEVLLELPEKIEEISYCELSEEQKNLYRSVFFSEKEKVKHDLSHASEGAAVMHVFALLSKLKQICNHPCLIYKEKDFSKHSSGKWDLFIELLEEARASRQKVVVFTQYLDMMDLIESYLDSRGIGFAQIRGSTRDRKEELRKFKEDAECEVFVASLQAAGVGIDLTSASIVIHYDRWWNPAKEDQATDRVHRMGQSRGVQVFKLITKKSVEENIHRLILKKKGILDEIVGFDEQDAIKKLTKQEIFELLVALEKDLQSE